ncbi:hypothetical protein AcW1_006652 [Taiwanofungus camphoratus]|nr:hypothetical protein AcV5_009240 [Antrodia cinnamomea]KAI0924558.1 hypothetical protein AcW2_005414 [Antrodia cinnamomea]KAI0954085.1 hypothetical protein AcV7_007418 [Antrodia cinnamomea]KAI0954897.1 hypothetical protein AcW1_006652 [Antrodia cinnamomea]
MNWVYAFVRHFPYVVQLIMISVTKAHTGVAWSAAGCHSWIVFQVAAMECVTVAVEIVLISRVYAMYNCNRAILTVLLLLFLAEIIAMIAIIVYSVPRASFITRWCLTTHAPNIFTLYWFISLAFESVLFAMTLVKLCSSISIGHSRRRSNHSSILFVLLRDGTWAFAVIFAVMLLNALMFRLVDNPLAGICFFWELSLFSSAGSHVLLNLRRLADRHDSNETSTWTAGENAMFSTHAIEMTALSTDTCDPAERHGRWDIGSMSASDDYTDV